MVSPRRPLALLLLPPLLLGAERAAARADPAPYTVRRARAPEKLPAPPRRPRYVLLVSIDGLSYAAWRRHRRWMPNLTALARQGFFRPVASVFPSVTWAAHASITTGQLPRHHGVLGNRWLEDGASPKLVTPYDSRDADAQRKARTPSLYELAAARGLTVAALNWPGTQGSTAIRYNMPEFMYSSLPYRMLSRPLRGLLGALYRREHKRFRPASYLPLLFNRFARREAVEVDLLVRDLALALVRPPAGLKRPPTRPRLLLLHLLTTDSWLHRYGTGAWVQRWTMELADAMLGRVFRAYRRAGIWRRTAVFVASDHGMAEISRAFDVRRLLRAKRFASERKVTSKNLARAQVVTSRNGHATFLYLRGSSWTAARRQELIALLKSQRRCVAAVFSPAAYARLGLPSPPRGNVEQRPSEHVGAPDLVLLTKASCVVRRSPRRARVVRKLGGWRLGHHGFLPRHKRLLALLIGKGPGIKRQGRAPLARASLTDVAPTIAHLLGLSWPTRWPAHPQRPFTLDGRILRDVLARRAAR